MIRECNCKGLMVFECSQSVGKKLGKQEKNW